MQNQYRSSLLKIRTSEALLVCPYLVNLTQCKGKINPTSQFTIYTYLQRLTCKRSRVNSSINPGNNYKGRLECKTKCCRHVYCWVFQDNYIAATEGKCYSYEKEPVSFDKQFTSQLMCLIICNNKLPYYHFQFAKLLARGFLLSSSSGQLKDILN